jgi:hypothetical protein
MKTIALAALTVLTLGAGAAFAQGVPPGTQPEVYGSDAFPKQPYHNGTIFSELFGHQPNSQLSTQGATVRNTTSQKGG